LHTNLYTNFVRSIRSLDWKRTRKPLKNVCAKYVAGLTYLIQSAVTKVFEEFDVAVLFDPIINEDCDWKWPSLIYPNQIARFLAVFLSKVLPIK
jgi:hypothetical protein